MASFSHCSSLFCCPFLYPSFLPCYMTYCLKPSFQSLKTLSIGWLHRPTVRSSFEKGLQIMAASSVCVSGRSHSQLPNTSPGDLQAPQAGLVQLLTNDCFCGRFCLRPLKVKPLLSSVLGAPAIKAEGLKAKWSGGSSTWCWTPRLGSMMEALNSHSCGRPSGGCKYPPVCGSSTYWCGIWEHWVSVPPTYVSLWFLVVPVFSGQRSFLVGSRVVFFLICFVFRVFCG